MRAESIEVIAPLAFAKAGALVAATVTFAARIADAQAHHVAISGVEIGLSAIGGVGGGLLLLPHLRQLADTAIERAYLVAIAGLAGGGVGPLLANWAARRLDFVAEGPFENFGAGILCGVLVPIFVGLLAGLFIVARQRPESILEFLRKLRELVILQKR